jgi:regulator of replication initiation timing
LRGCFDEPTAGALRRQPQLFYGWALDGERPTSKVELICNGTVTVEADLGMPRPDVPLNLGEPNGAPACGWSALIDLARWPEGDLEVMVMASGRSGRRVGLGSRSFRLEGTDLGGQVSALHEQVSALHEQVSTLHEQVSTLHEQVSALHEQVSTLHESDRGLEHAQASLQAQIDDIRLHHHAAFETVVGLSLSAMRAVDATADPPDLSATSTFATITFNYRVHRSLAWQAQHRSRVGDWSGVLEAARVAAEWSWFNHPGVFSSRVLEEAIGAAGRHLLDTSPDTQPPTPGARRRILHVLTQALPIGGHTRLAERWMRFDTGSDHALALTEQGDLPVPDALAGAAGLGVHRFDTLAPADRVRSLSALLLGFDLVVLHIHPYDAAAVAACSASQGPPVAFVNHADHVFWLGVGVSDLIVNIRPSGAALSVGRRGMAAARSVVLPLPLDQVARTRQRPEAKRELGLPLDAVLMLTMASSTKYAAIGEPTFVGLARQTLMRESATVLMGVGPDLETPGWKELAEDFPGRVIASGATADTALILQAADLYLDSLPFASLTSLLEASLYGVPVVCFRGHGLGAMAADDAVVELPSFDTSESWLSAVSALVRDARERERLGAELALRVGAGHFAGPWRARLEQVYASTLHAARALPSVVEPTVTPFDVALQRFDEASGQSGPAEAVLGAHDLLDGGFGW